MTEYLISIIRKTLKEPSILVLSENKILEAPIILHDSSFTSRLNVKEPRDYKSRYRIRIGEYCIFFEQKVP